MRLILPFLACALHAPLPALAQVDLCEHVSCSGHGRCAIQMVCADLGDCGPRPICRCDQGYEPTLSGLDCLPVDHTRITRKLLWAGLGTGLVSVLSMAGFHALWYPAHLDYAAIPSALWFATHAVSQSLLIRAYARSRAALGRRSTDASLITASIHASVSLAMLGAMAFWSDAWVLAVVVVADVLWAAATITGFVLASRAHRNVTTVHVGAAPIRGGGALGIHASF